MLLRVPRSLLCVVSVLYLPLSAFSARVQRSDLVLPQGASVHRDAARQIFVDSYEAYKKYAFSHDDLRPISKGFRDSRNGWGASIIDGMSTMKIMGLDDYFDEAVKFASTIDFSRSKTPDLVSVFETSIRYLGGLLSAYELSNQKHSILLDKAKQVADKLTFAWIDGNDLPYGHLNFTSQKPQITTSNIAEAGTLALEWMTLSKYTKDDQYRILGENALRKIAQLVPPLPGLAAQGLDPANGGSFVGSLVTWGGGSDSYFEYLIKYARLTNTNDHIFADTWNTAVDTSSRVLRQVSSVGQHVYLGEWENGLVHPVSSHLACFHGGNWILGGKLVGNDTVVQLGLELVDACWNTYESTATGIGPETFRWIPQGDNSAPPPDRADFYQKHGFTIGSSYYMLRPEVLESNFHAYRVTGDNKYLDRAAKAIGSFKRFLSSPDVAGYTGISDVNNPQSQRIDAMESFWFAEALKYLYLTFDDPAHISLDDYVFNTEAHPFRAPPALDTYGTGMLRREGADTFKTNTGPIPSVSQIPGVEEFQNLFDTSHLLREKL